MLCICNVINRTDSNSYASKLCIIFQDLIEGFYDPVYRFHDFVKDLAEEKIVGDELTLVLLSRYLKRNITVISPFNTWTMFPTMTTDIVLTYDGRFWPTQDLSTSAVAQSKSEELLKLFLNIS